MLNAIVITFTNKFGISNIESINDFMDHSIENPLSDISKYFKVMKGINPHITVVIDDSNIEVLNLRLQNFVCDHAKHGEYYEITNYGAKTP